VPANRSRTERWRESLEQIQSRGGGIEIAIAHPEGDGPTPSPADLLWRVRLFRVSNDELVIECPGALGQSVELAPNTPLNVVMAIGQNRWTFRSVVLGATEMPGPVGRPMRTLRIASPDQVERIQRRNFYRAEIGPVTLPKVECWSLLSPASVVAAEVANRVRIQDLLEAGISGGVSTPGVNDQDPAVMPEVGPSFNARLVNIGGGGVGLMIDRSDARALDRCRMFWLRFDLTPTIPAPLALSAKLVHTHMDSEQNVYAGLAFDFTFHQAHREFVVDQICRYAAHVQQQARLSVKKTAA
jgi:hypothetical protein